MGKQQDIEQYRNSQKVLEQYMSYVEENGASSFHHKAWVLIEKRDYQYHNVLEIGTMIINGVSKIILCGDNEFIREFYREYTNEYQQFLSYRLGTVTVKDAVDIQGNQIKMDISFYK